MADRPIRLPPNFTVPGELRDYYELALDDTKFALYTTVQLSVPELAGIRAHVRQSFLDNIGLLEDEIDEDLYDAPEVDFSGQSLTDVVTYHYSHINDSESSSSSEDSIPQWYPFAFVVVDNENWVEDGLVILNWDVDAGLNAFRIHHRDLGVVLRNLRDECYVFSDQKAQYEMIKPSRVTSEQVQEG